MTEYILLVIESILENNAELDANPLFALFRLMYLSPNFPAQKSSWDVAHFFMVTFLLIQDWKYFCLI